MENTNLRGQFSIREFVVDFFGSLMPGVLFLFFMIISLFSSVLVAIITIQCYCGKCSETIEALLGSLKMLHYLNSAATFVIFLFFISLGYVIGTLFYRRDPKEPDYKSFLRIASKLSSRDEMKNWVVKIKMKTEKNVSDRYKAIGFWDRLFHLRIWQSNAVKKTLNKLKNYSETHPDDKFIYNRDLINILTVEEKEIQFPYNNLSGYLISRGRGDLAKYVNWSENGENEKSEEDKHKSHRSKLFINSLKIRLQFKYPEKCGTINKNEAHVRLTSSMWYASNALIKLALLGSIIVIAASIFYFTSSGDFMPGLILYPLTLNLAVFYFSRQARMNSEIFLHYQRVREILYVLETAKVASQEVQGLDFDPFKSD